MYDIKPDLYDDKPDLYDDMTDLYDDMTDLYAYPWHVWYQVIGGDNPSFGVVSPYFKGSMARSLELPMEELWIFWPIFS